MMTGMRHLPLGILVSLIIACNSAEPPPNPGAPDAGTPPVAGALAACVDNGFVGLWDVSNLHGPIGTMALSDNGVLAVASLDGSLKQWVVGMSAEEAPLPAGRPSYGTTFVDEGNPVGAIAFTHDAGMLLGGDETGTVYQWQASDSALMSTHPLGDQPVVALAVAPDDAEVVLADASFAGNLRVWTRASGAVSDALTTELWSVAALRYTAGGSGFVVAGEWYGVYSIEHWDSANLSAPAHRWTTDELVNGKLHAVALSADGTYVYAAGTNDVLVFDSSDFSLGPIARATVPGGELNAVVATAGYVVTTGADGMLRMFVHDAAAGTLTEVAGTTITQPVGLAVDASGKRLLSAGGDGRVRALGCAE